MNGCVNERIHGCACSHCAQSLQLHPTLCDPVDCSPPGSSVHGILQAGTLEWVAISFARGIFLTQGSNPGLPHCRQTLYRLSHLKNLPPNTEDVGLIPGSGRSPGEGNGYPPQYSCLENSMDRGAWWVTVHGIMESLTQLSD